MESSLEESQSLFSESIFKAIDLDSKILVRQGFKRASGQVYHFDERAYYKLVKEQGRICPADLGYHSVLKEVIVQEPGALLIQNVIQGDVVSERIPISGEPFGCRAGDIVQQKYFRKQALRDGLDNFLFLNFKADIKMSLLDRPRKITLLRQPQIIFPEPPKQPPPAPWPSSTLTPISQTPKPQSQTAKAAESRLLCVVDNSLHPIPLKLVQNTGLQQRQASPLSQQLLTYLSTADMLGGRVSRRRPGITTFSKHEVFVLVGKRSRKVLVRVPVRLFVSDAAVGAGLGAGFAGAAGGGQLGGVDGGAVARVVGGLGAAGTGVGRIGLGADRPKLYQLNAPRGGDGEDGPGRVAGSSRDRTIRERQGRANQRNEPIPPEIRKFAETQSSPGGRQSSGSTITILTADERPLIISRMLGPVMISRLGGWLLMTMLKRRENRWYFIPPSSLNSDDLPEKEALVETEAGCPKEDLASSWLGKREIQMEDLRMVAEKPDTDLGSHSKFPRLKKSNKRCSSSSRNIPMLSAAASTSHKLPLETREIDPELAPDYDELEIGILFSSQKKLELVFTLSVNSNRRLDLTSSEDQTTNYLDPSSSRLHQKEISLVKSHVKTPFETFNQKPLSEQDAACSSASSGSPSMYLPKMIVLPQRYASIIRHEIEKELEQDTPTPNSVIEAEMSPVHPQLLEFQVGLYAISVDKTDSTGPALLPHQKIHYNFHISPRSYLDCDMLTDPTILPLINSTENWPDDSPGSNFLNQSHVISFLIISTFSPHHGERLYYCMIDTDELTWSLYLIQSDFTGNILFHATHQPQLPSPLRNIFAEPSKPTMLRRAITYSRVVSLKPRRTQELGRDDCSRTQVIDGENNEAERVSSHPDLLMLKISKAKAAFDDWYALKILGCLVDKQLLTPI